MRSGPRTSSRLLKSAEYFCWGLGGLLLTAQLGYGLVAHWSHGVAMASFEDARAAGSSAAAQPAPAPRSPLGYAEPDLSTWSPSRVRSYEALAAVLWSPPEAVLRIPRLALEVPVFPGATDFNMTRGAGRLDGSPRFGEWGNVGLSSHRDGYFRKLKDVAVGDEIVVDTRTHSYHYVVATVIVTDPSDTAVLGTGEVPELTLVTCYPFYFQGRAPQRFVVRAELRQEYP